MLAGSIRSSRTTETLLSFLPALEEPDPSMGRWRTPHPGEVREDLLRSCVNTRELLEEAVEHVRLSPQRTSTVLLELIEKAGAEADRQHTERLRAEYHETIRQVHAGEPEPESLPGRHVDEIVRIAAPRAAIRPDRWLPLLGRCDRFSRQRVAAESARAGRTQTLEGLLAVQHDVWDIPLLVEGHMRAAGSEAAAQLVKMLDDTLSYDSTRPRSWELARVRHAAEATIEAGCGRPEERHIWSDMLLGLPAACYPGSETLTAEGALLTRSRLKGAVAQQMAVKLHDMDLPLRRLHDTVESILEPHPAENRGPQSIEEHAGTREAS